MERGLARAMAVKAKSQIARGTERSGGSPLRQRIRRLKGRSFMDRWNGLQRVIVGLALFVGAPRVGADDSRFLRGDANRDGRLDIADPVFTLDFSFRGSREPTCRDAADANDDGGIDISDAIHSLSFLFSGGKAPPLPFPAVGLDPTADALGCGPAGSGMGTLLVAIHDVPPESLTEFWITLDEVTVFAADGSSLDVFPPAGEPGAEKTVNLLDHVAVSSIVSAIEVPAGDYTGVHLEFDHAFARSGTEDIVVSPDAGEARLTFAAPVTVTEGNLTALLVDFNLAASLEDGGPGKVLLDPQIAADDDEEDDGKETELGELHGTVISVDVANSRFVVEVLARGDNGEHAAVGQVTVVVDASTEFEDVSGLEALEAGQTVEVEGTLQDDGTLLASEVELKGADEGEDLDDNHVDDDDEDPDHDSDIDNDGHPNDEDGDDDGDGIDDGEDNDGDNDGENDDVDEDDDNDGHDDEVDDDDDGDGLEDEADDDDDDNDDDGTPDIHDGDDDGDGVSDDEEDDSDGDGIDDDSDRDDDDDGVSDDEDEDDDNDGEGDEEEEAEDDNDSDDDGLQDAIDEDDDNDGVADAHDADDDGDGVADEDEPDSDEDGIADDSDLDDDGDGVPDAEDDDDDGNGLEDEDEHEDDEDEHEEEEEEEEEGEDGAEA
jgi:hypothetical protein